jgi:hypothetical protein
MYAALVEGGVDDLMAKHVAHLFIREENFKSKNWLSDKSDTSRRCKN